MKRKLDATGYTQYLAVIVVVIILAIGVLAVVFSDSSGGEGEYAAVAELNVTMVNVDLEEETSLTITVPGTISVTDEIMTFFTGSLATQTVTDDKEWNKDQQVKFRVEGEVWWQGKGLESVDELFLSQQAQDSGGTGFTVDGYGYKSTRTYNDLQIERSEDNTTTVAPGDYFKYYYGGSTITAGDVDGSQVSTDFTLQATDETGQSLNEQVTTEVEISLTLYESSLDFSADMTEADVQ